MLDKILASIGIGAARVDARMKDAGVRQGEELSGEVHVIGGNVEQSISQIYMYLYTEYYRETNGGQSRQKEVLASYRVSDSLIIRPAETKVIPFRLRVPYHAPISFNTQRIYLSTGLDIEMAVDPKDKDLITVLPDPLLEQILQEAEHLGFRHTSESGYCEYKRHIHRMVPFVQEFELAPTSLFKEELDEIELIFDVHLEGVDVLLEVGHKARGVADLLEDILGLDERYVRFSVSRKQGLAPGELTTMIQRGLDMMMK